MKKFLLLCFLSPLWLHTSAQSLEQGKSVTGKSEKDSPKLVSSDARTVQAVTQSKAASGDAVHLEVKYPEYWPDRVFIKMKDNQAAKLETFETKAARRKSSTGKVNNTLRRFEPSRVSELPKSARLASFRNTYEVVVEKPEQLNQLLSELNAMPEVAYAERVPLYYTFTPNDPMFGSGQQYAINKIKAVEAAGIHTGTSKTLLAIVDDAVLISHPDLLANVDAARSYDVADRDNDPRPPAAGTNKASATSFSHGTHCAGIAGAVTNNGVGISAVSNNKISIIGVKCTSDLTADSRLIERSLEGVLYAINQGARVISMSFGGTGTSQTFQNIINEATANGVVFVAAAGNSAVETKHYPAAYDNVIAVASSDSKDLKSSFSNFGTWVDVSAPGSSILSTVANGSAGEYTSYNGTSMATPMVAGLVALMLSQNPNLTAQAVTEILRNSSDPIDNVQGQAFELMDKLGAGRINAFKAIQAIKALTPLAAPTAITSLQVNRTAKTEVDLSWTAPALGGTEPAVLYDIRYATTPITAANFSNATRTVKNITPAKPGTAQALTVTGLMPGTTYYFAIVARALYGDGSPLSNVVNTATLAAPHIQVSEGTATTFNINRDNSTTATGSFTVTNSGTEDLTYSITPNARSGANIAGYDKQGSNADNKFGPGTSGFMVATRFIAGPRGFNLTHVQNYLSNSTTVTNATIGVRILKGGTSPANATLLATQNFTPTIPAGGELLTFALQQAHQLAPGEVFWVAFVIPSGLTTPQGFDTNRGVLPNTFYYSSNGGSSYDDAQQIAPFLNATALKIRAVDAAWLSVTPVSGTIPAGQSREVTFSINAANVVNGTYQTDIVYASNAPLTPEVARPLTVTVTGGKATLAVANPTLDYGTIFAGSSSTAKVTVKNTGVASLNISSVTFNGGTFPASDFAIAHALPLAIQPGTEQELSFKFTPSKKAALTGTVTFLADNLSAAPSAVNMVANLINPPMSLVTASEMDVVLNKATGTTATRSIRIQNTGEAQLNYTVRVMADTANTMAYDANRNADSFLGFQNTTTPLHAAVKFKVTTPRFILSEVQNYYRSMTESTNDVIVKVYKGGATPSAGTLLLQQTANHAASVQNGALVTVPLQQQQQFVKGDIFWVVFVHTGVTSPQGVTSNAPADSANFYSANGTNWTAWTTSSFKIRALGTPTWLSITSATGALNQEGQSEASLLIDAAALEPGVYAGHVIVNSNSFTKPNEIIRLNLQVVNTQVANPTSLSRDLEQLEGVTVYPNPVDDKFTMEFTAEKPGDLQIRLLSLTGNLVYEEVHSNFRGAFKQQVQTHKFAAGIYILQMQQGDKVHTRKLIIR